LSITKKDKAPFSIPVSLLFPPPRRTHSPHQDDSDGDDGSVVGAAAMAIETETAAATSGLALEMKVV